MLNFTRLVHVNNKETRINRDHQTLKLICTPPCFSIDTNQKETNKGNSQRIYKMQFN